MAGDAIARPNLGGPVEQDPAIGSGYVAFVVGKPKPGGLLGAGQAISVSAAGFLDRCCVVRRRVISARLRH
jgi:hypothetical protein